MIGKDLLFYRKVFKQVISKMKYSHTEFTEVITFDSFLETNREQDYE